LGDFVDEVAKSEADLAKMLSRYDREAARALLEPFAARLPQIAAPGATTLVARHALTIAQNAMNHTQNVVIAAAFIDPRWAVELIASLPRSAEKSWRRPDDVSRWQVATVLAQSDERWTDGRGYGAGFWMPPETRPSATEADQLNNEQSGVGLALAVKDGQLVIGAVLPNSPAAASGALHANDRIIAIGQGGDAPVAADSLSFEQVIAAVRGKRGAVVRLTIVPDGKNDDEAVVVSLTRGVVKELNFFGRGTKLKVGSDAPDMPYARLDDEEEEHIADLKGKILVICFWASWCGPCKPLVEELQMLPAQKPGWGDRVRVLALSVDENRETALQVGREHHWDNAQLGWCGPDGLHVFDVSSLPKLFVIDTRGKIAAVDHRRKVAETVDELLDAGEK
ncbi:MAG TPA: thioredoxin-like domain-containing protein, partial [Pirellulales bacterium]|nr:thioredoxin-like domain-containing protein [Pirellulales bacterium]